MIMASPSLIAKPLPSVFGGCGPLQNYVLARLESLQLMLYTGLKLDDWTGYEHCRRDTTGGSGPGARGLFQ
jgi:hypothetical protein